MLWTSASCQWQGSLNLVTVSRFFSTQHSRQPQPGSQNWSLKVKLISCPSWNLTLCFSVVHVCKLGLCVVSFNLSLLFFFFFCAYFVFRREKKIFLVLLESVSWIDRYVWARDQTVLNAAIREDSWCLWSIFLLILLLYFLIPYAVYKVAQ